MSRQFLNQAVISQLLSDLRNGQLRSSLDMGFTEEDIRLLQDPERVSLLSSTSVKWVAVKVIREVMRGLLNRVTDLEKETLILDEMIRRGASSKMISDLFGLNPRDVAFRKKVLQIDAKQGRWKELEEETHHQIWRDWQAKIKQYQLDIHNMMDMAKVCMILAKDYQVPMAMIWQAMEKWLEPDEGGA